MTDKQTTEIAKTDLLAAWAVLENLAVSLDQIGGTFAGTDEGANGMQQTVEMQHALSDYVTPELVSAINEARSALGQYVSDEDAETLTDDIPYWDYKSTPRLAKNI